MAYYRGQLERDGLRIYCGVCNRTVCHDYRIFDMQHQAAYGWPVREHPNAAYTEKYIDQETNG